MITEYFMHKYNWDAVWYAHPCRFLGMGPRFHVGTWTGPDMDLICVKRCNKKEEAEEHLSPAGWIVLHATILAVIKLWKLRKNESL